ncbi:MAG: exodeoxyribonuclease VII small subunit [candidate division Zixibacteria bacterium]|nr:exodeoxyribonuclease VII small subunit [candidate division Zixibacteria bacterium]
MTPAKKAQEPKKFEDAFERLSEIVEQLENAEAGLEESLDLYAEGMKLARFCGEKLGEAEKKIQKLSEKLQVPVEPEFDEEPEEDEE